MRRLAASLILSIAVAGLIGGCDSGDKEAKDSRAKGTDTSARTTTVAAGIAEPRKVEASGKVGARAVEKVYGREVSPGQPVVIGSSCKQGDCIIRYRSQARGEGK